MTKTVKAMNELIKSLKESKEISEKQFEETADQFANLMTMKELGLVKGEQLEEVNVGIIGAMALGSIVSATLEAIDGEIKCVEKALEKHLSKNANTKEEAVEEKESDLEKDIKVLSSILGIDLSELLTMGSK